MYKVEMLVNERWVMWACYPSEALAKQAARNIQAVRYSVRIIAA